VIPKVSRDDGRVRGLEFRDVRMQSFEKLAETERRVLLSSQRRGAIIIPKDHSMAVRKNRDSYGSQGRGDYRKKDTKGRGGWRENHGFRSAGFRGPVA